VVDADLRWAALLRLVVLGLADEDAIGAESARDPGARGAEHAARCRAALPDPAAKARAWERIRCDDGTPARLLIAAATGFWQPEQAALTSQYVERYRVDVPAMAARRTPATVRHVAIALFPRYAVSAATLTATDAMLARPDLDPALRRVVTDAAAELRRALAARARAAPPDRS
jgi:aminopeptidase N